MEKPPTEGDNWYVCDGVYGHKLYLISIPI